MAMIHSSKGVVFAATAVRAQTDGVRDRDWIGRRAVVTAMATQAQTDGVCARGWIRKRDKRRSNSRVDADG